MYESVDEWTKRLEELNRRFSETYWTVSVYAEGAPAGSDSERTFGPFFVSDEAKLKATELEEVCRQMALSKRISIDETVPKVSWSRPDEPLVYPSPGTGENLKPSRTLPSDANPGEFPKKKTGIYHIVGVYDVAAEYLAEPEKRFGPFYELEAAEAKKREIEAVCERKGRRRTVTIKTITPPTPLSPPDEPYGE